MNIPEQVQEIYFSSIKDYDLIDEYDFYFKKQYFLQNNMLKDNPNIKSNLSLFNMYKPNLPMTTLLDKGFKPSRNELYNPKEFVVCLTHDIDVINPTILSKLFQLYKKRTPITKTLFKRSFNNFNKIIEIEKKYNATSTFFFLSTRKDISTLNYKRVNYKLKSMKDIFTLIVENNDEIGLHGGYWTYNNIDKLKQEKGDLEKIAGINILSYRNHYLRFHFFETWKNLEKLNFKIDSTFGWNDAIGFRNGWPFVFCPYDFEQNRILNIHEFPLIVMDSAIDSMGLTLDDAYNKIIELIEIVKKYHGVMTVNWHNNYFDEDFFPGYSKLYEKILNYVFQNEGELLSLKDFFEK